jgi:cold shock CspA family protein
MYEVEFGLVKFYKNGYGFVIRDGKEDLFFHIKNYGTPEASKEYVSFRRSEPCPRYPQPGDKVAFQIGWSEKGPIASPWSYAEEYEKALKKHQNWPEPTRYRILVIFDQSHLQGGGTGEPHTEWSGTYDELIREYPRDRHDKLAYFGHSDFNATYIFQKFVDGEWKSIEDPRPYVEDRFRRRY